MKLGILLVILLMGSLLTATLQSNLSHISKDAPHILGVGPWHTTPAAPNATISVQPNATIDLSRTMKQITIEIALNNTPDVPPFNAISIQLSYNYRILKASSLNYSTNVFAQTNFPTAIVRDCLDIRPPPNTSGLCGTDDGPGITSFAETILGGETPEGTHGNIFFLTFDVNTTAPAFSQIEVTQAILALGSSPIPVSTRGGIYSSLNCNGNPCPPPIPKTGDFGIHADPASLTIHKSTLYDPSAQAFSTIHIASLNGTSGLVQLQALTTVPTPNEPQLKLSRSFVILRPNSTEDLILNVSAAISSLETYYVNVTGTLSPPFGSPPTASVRHSVIIPVEVVGPPLDFKLVIPPIYSNDLVIAGGSTQVVVQVLSVGADIFNSTITLIGHVSPSASFGPTLSFNPTQINLVFSSEASDLMISTSENTPPGNYTVIVDGKSGAIVHAVQFQLTVLPPPVIALSRSSGSVGTKVIVHGSGFLNPSSPQANAAPIQIEITFDDQLVGLISTSSGSFDFTFNVPEAQVGITHLVHAKEASLDSQASFLVLPDLTPLMVNVTSGTIYFQGDTATISILTTLDGQPTTVANLQVTLVRPDGSNITVVPLRVSGGFYKATYLLPMTGSLGTYTIVVRAHQPGSTEGSALGTFEVKPTWLQSNGHNLLTAASVVGVVGLLGVLGLASKRGYLANFSRMGSSRLPEQII
jgi:hypothetical protein